MSVSREAMTFLWACLAGAGLGVIYDCFRLCRLVCGNWIAVFLEDLLFSAFCTLTTLVFCVEFCNGRIRAYVLLGEALGFIIYHFTVGELVIRLLRAVVSLIRALFGGVYRIFVFPVWKAVCFIAQKIKKVFVLILQCFARTPFLKKFPLQEQGEMLYNNCIKHACQNKDGAQRDEGKKKQGKPYR